LSIFEFEVFIPMVDARMEQLYNFSGRRIDAREIGPFERIASVTSQCKIVHRVIGDVLLGNDVLNMERNEWRRLFRHVAVFAMVTGTASHECPSCGVHAQPS